MHDLEITSSDLDELNQLMSMSKEDFDVLFKEEFDDPERELREAKQDRDLTIKLVKKSRREDAKRKRSSALKSTKKQVITKTKSIQKTVEEKLAIIAAAMQKHPELMAQFRDFKGSTDDEIDNLFEDISELGLIDESDEVQK